MEVEESWRRREEERERCKFDKKSYLRSFFLLQVGAMM
jgi:hypothetical protein